MSDEEEINIHQLEEGEISEIILVCTEHGQDEADTNIDLNSEKVESLEHEFDLKESIDVLGDAHDDELVSTDHVKESNVQYGSNDDLNFGDVAYFSTPVTIEATIISHSNRDVTHLKENGSSVIKPFDGNDVEGNNDNTSEASCGCCYDDDRECNHVSLAKALTRESLMLPGLIRVPIIGHETMDARAKFTVFKIHVMVEDDDVGWFIFRRYSDFVNLNDQLKLMFPSFRFILPPKRWFKSNFDTDFLEERQQGLQSFIDNITGHRDICKCKPVRDFFCFDDPPGPHDSLEESRAQCECLEEMVYILRKELSEKDTEIELLKEEMDLYKNQVQLLSTRLSQLNKITTLDRCGSEKHRSKFDDKQLDIDDNQLDPDDTQLDTDDKQLNTDDNQFDTDDKENDTDDKQLDMDDKQLGGDDKQLDTDYRQFYTDDKLDMDDRQLDTGDKQLGGDDKQLDTGDKQLGGDNKQLDPGDKQLNTDDKQLSGEDKQLDTGDKQLDTDDKQLGGDDKQLDTGDKQLDTDDKQLK